MPFFSRQNIHVPFKKWVNKPTYQAVNKWVIPKIGGLSRIEKELVCYLPLKWGESNLHEDFGSQKPQKNMRGGTLRNSSKASVASVHLGLGWGRVPGTIWYPKDSWPDGMTGSPVGIGWLSSRDVCCQLRFLAEGLSTLPSGKTLHNELENPPIFNG